VEEKARWLAERPIGKNYNVTGFRRILPIAVTPFVEFIPGTESWFWLTQELPRVLTPWELQEALGNHILEGIPDDSPNFIKIQTTDIRS
jgi:hypothetical protein